MRSMTGFGSKTITLETADGTRSHLSMSLKSLNSRYFEASCRLPHQINNLETKLTKLLKKNLHRGHLYLTVHMSESQTFKGTVSPSLAIIKDYLAGAQKIKQETGVSGDITLAELIKLPNAFIFEQESLDEKTEKTIIDAVKELIQIVIAEQEQEGTTLQKDLMARIDEIEREIDEIEKAAQQLMEKKKQQIVQATAELEGDESLRAEVERAAFHAVLDKIDIHEEIVRFKSHTQNLRTHLNSDQIEKGKRIDFTLQELAREINTIAAKCSDAAIGSMAINIKVEIEKAREQAQNIV